MGCCAKPGDVAVPTPSVKGGDLGWARAADGPGLNPKSSPWAGTASGEGTATHISRVRGKLRVIKQIHGQSGMDGWGNAGVW